MQLFSVLFYFFVPAINHILFEIHSFHLRLTIEHHTRNGHFFLSFLNYTIYLIKYVHHFSVRSPTSRFQWSHNHMPCVVWFKVHLPMGNIYITLFNIHNLFGSGETLYKSIQIIWLCLDSQGLMVVRYEFQTSIQWSKMKRWTGKRFIENLRS